MISFRALAPIVLAGTLTACSAYSGYAAAIVRDVDTPTKAIVRVVSRLQATVVSGSVPVDSIPVWAKELDGVAKLAAKTSTDLATVRPPDPRLQANHSKLVLWTAKQSAAVAAAAAEAKTCLSGASDGCERLTSTEYYKVLEPIADAQVNLRWRRGDIAQDLKAHGVNLPGRIE
jgi:hypothetical protein